MRHIFKGLSIVATVLGMTTATPAHAQWQIFPPGPGFFYLGGEGGWTALSDEKGSVPGKTFPETWKSGFNAGARIGYEWGPWRFEEEFRYQDNDVSSIARHPARGGRRAHALLSNAIYDLPLGGKLSPHIGVGVGVINLRERVTVPILGLGVVTRGSDWQFAYQGIAGIRYEISPALAFDLDYRYLGTTRSHFRTPPGLVVDGAPAGNLRVISGYRADSVMASLSVRFGAASPRPVGAPPAPPAPPPPMIARKVFLVFFDWDRDTITPEGMQVVQQAAASFRAGGAVTIQVTGYADRSGSPGYNQLLSERRANNIAAAMVRLGVPRQQMAVGGRGENDNRVPTADGAREPQNRRVEIVFP